MKLVRLLFVFMLLALIPINAHAATPLLTSARITGPNTVTLTFSESVNTLLADYTVFTGALNGRSLSTISGAGTNMITLTFSGNAFPVGSSGGMTLGSGIVSLSDGSVIGAGPVTISDGQPGIITSMTIATDAANNTVARAGNTITVSFSTNETSVSPVVTIAGHQVTANGSGIGPFSASYTLTIS